MTKRNILRLVCAFCGVLMLAMPQSAFAGGPDNQIIIVFLLAYVATGAFIAAALFFWIFSLLYLKFNKSSLKGIASFFRYTGYLSILAGALSWFALALGTFSITSLFMLIPAGYMAAAGWLVSVSARENDSPGPGSLWKVLKCFLLFLASIILAGGLLYFGGKYGFIQ